VPCPGFTLTISKDIRWLRCEGHITKVWIDAEVWKAADGTLDSPCSAADETELTVYASYSTYSNLPEDLTAITFKAITVDLEFDADSDVDSKVCAGCAPCDMHCQWC
jgi:hypothetical protein